MSILTNNLLVARIIYDIFFVLYYDIIYTQLKIILYSIWGGYIDEKRYIFIFITAILLIIGLYACNDSIKYKQNISKSVKSNIDYLNSFVKQQDLTISDQLLNMGIKEVQIKDGFIIFVVDSTGLLDGGVEYGFYYSTTSDELNKSWSANDYMVIKKITDNWYYYEWHNG